MAGPLWKRWRPREPGGAQPQQPAETHRAEARDVGARRKYIRSGGWSRRSIPTVKTR